MAEIVESVLRPGIIDQLDTTNDQPVVRSVMVVRDGGIRHLQQNFHDGSDCENAESGQLITVTDLLNNNASYMVEALACGDRLFFHLNKGDAVAELNSEADVSNVASELSRRLATQLNLE